MIVSWFSLNLGKMDDAHSSHKELSTANSLFKQLVSSVQHSRCLGSWIDADRRSVDELKPKYVDGEIGIMLQRFHCLGDRGIDEFQR